MADFMNSLFYRSPETPEAKIARLETELASAKRLANSHMMIAESFCKNFDTLRRYIELSDRVPPEPQLHLTPEDRQLLADIDSAFKDADPGPGQ